MVDDRMEPAEAPLAAGCSRQATETLRLGSGAGTPVGGFTLLEAVVALAILAIVLGAFVPLVATARDRDRVDATRRKLALLKRAVVGEPLSAAEGEFRFGFVGDLGQLPPDLDHLVRPGPFSPYTVDTQRGLGVGWRGPYLPAVLADDTASLEQDGFGRAIRYAVKDTSVGGVPWVGFLQSGGPDGTRGTADDLFAPLLAREVEVDAHAFLVDGRGRAIANAPMEMVFRRDGSLKDTLLATDAEGHALAPDVPVGSTVVRASTDATGQQAGFIVGSETTTGNQFQDVEFSIVNVSDAPVTLTSLTVTSVVPNTDDRCYREAVVGGVEVLPPGAGSIRCEGEILTFPEPVTLEPGTASPASVAERTLGAQGPVTLAPELRIGGDVDEGTGTALVVLGDWRVSGGSGPRADMRGIELTVQLSDGLLFTFTAPG